MNRATERSDIDTTLVTIHQALASLNIFWMIIGSTSLYLSGYDVKPQDIDIFTTRKNAVILEKALQPYKLDFVNYPDSKFRSAFSKYLINGVTVEVMGGLEVNTESGWVLLKNYINNPVEVKHRDCIFTVPGAADQKRIYKLFNRAKDDRVIALLGED